MTPVGIDLSLTSTGISCGEMLKTVTSSYRSVQRLQDVRNKIMTDLSSVDNPIVCIEGYSFNSRNSQAHSIGELGGVIRLALYELNIPYVEIPPTTRAKFATGRGNAGKTEVMSSVSARTGLVFTGKGADDMCDAWILEEIGRTRYSEPRIVWPAESMKALDKIEWIDNEIH